MGANSRIQMHQELRVAMSCASGGVVGGLGIADLCCLATQAIADVDTNTEMVTSLIQREGLLGIARRGAAVAWREASPICTLLLATADPGLMLARWNRFNQQIGVPRRTQLHRIGRSTIAITRHFDNGMTSRPEEDLIVCSTICGALARIGYTVGFRQFRFGAHDPNAIWMDDDIGEPMHICLLEDHTRLTEPPPPALTMRDADSDLAPLVTALEATAGAPWSVADAAQAMAMSERSLQRRLQRAAITFPLLLRALRIREASHQLRRGRLSLTTIAYQYGFSDAAHFSRQFKEAAGLTPANCRDLIRHTK